MAYAARLYHEYCADVGHLPFTPEALDPLEQPQQHGRLHDYLGYLRLVKPHCAVTTLSQYVSTARSYLEINAIKLQRSKLLNQTILRLQQQPAPAKPARQPATAQLIAATVTDTSISLATRVAVQLAYSQLLRSREYTSLSTRQFLPQATMLRSHVVWHAHLDAYEILLCFSKSDVYSNGYTFYIYRDPEDTLCVVAALQHYLLVTSNNHPSLPLFVHADGSYLVAQQVTDALRKHAATYKLPPSLVSSHSIRLGGAFRLMDAKVAWQHIKAHGRWKTDNVCLAYTRLSDQRVRIAADALALGKRPLSQSFPIFPSSAFSA